MPVLMQHCPHCLSTVIQRSGRHGCPETLLRLFCIHRYRCHDCGARFYRFRTPFVKTLPAVNPRYAHGSPSYDHPATNNGGGTMNEDGEITLNKVSGQIREAIEKVKAMPPPPEWKPAPGQRNLLKERIAQAKAEIAERAAGLKGAERGQLVARIYKHYLRTKVR